MRHIKLFKLSFFCLFVLVQNCCFYCVFCTKLEGQKQIEAIWLYKEFIILILASDKLYDTFLHRRRAMVFVFHNFCCNCIKNGFPQSQVV